MTTPSKITQTAVRLLGDIARAFTKHHGDLEVHGADMTGAIVLSVRANRADHPKLIGSQGKHINALKTIFEAYGTQVGRRVNLALLDPAVGEKGPPAPFSPNPSWKPGEAIDLLQRLLSETLPTGFDLRLVPAGGLTTIAVEPNVWDRMFDGLFPIAVDSIFHAIGKSQGTELQVRFCRAEVPA